METKQHLEIVGKLDNLTIRLADIAAQVTVNTRLLKKILEEMGKGDVAEQEIKEFLPLIKEYYNKNATASIKTLQDFIDRNA